MKCLVWSCGNLTSLAAECSNSLGDVACSHGGGMEPGEKRCWKKLRWNWYIWRDGNTAMELQTVKSEALQSFLRNTSHFLFSSTSRLSTFFERLSQIKVKVNKLHKGSSVWLSKSFSRQIEMRFQSTMILPFDSTLETSKDKSFYLRQNFRNLSCLSKYPILQETHR